jgi:hypothetical protein
MLVGFWVAAQLSVSQDGLSSISERVSDPGTSVRKTVKDLRQVSQSEDRYLNPRPSEYEAEMLPTGLQSSVA